MKSLRTFGRAVLRASVIGAGLLLFSWVSSLLFNMLDERVRGNLTGTVSDATPWHAVSTQAAPAPTGEWKLIEGEGFEAFVPIDCTRIPEGNPDMAIVEFGDERVVLGGSRIPGTVLPRGRLVHAFRDSFVKSFGGKLKLDSMPDDARVGDAHGYFTCRDESGRVAKVKVVVRGDRLSFCAWTAKGFDVDDEGTAPRTDALRPVLISFTTR